MGLSDLIAGGMDATAATELLLNVVWTIIGATLVYFMQAGFAMCEAGFTRAKNTGNILMKNMMDFVLGSLFFFIFGFAIMHGTDWNGIIGIKGSSILQHLPMPTDFSTDCQSESSLFSIQYSAPHPLLSYPVLWQNVQNSLLTYYIVQQSVFLFTR